MEKNVSLTFEEYYELKSKAQAYDNILNQVRPVDYANRPEANWPACQKEVRCSQN